MEDDRFPLKGTTLQKTNGATVLRINNILQLLKDHQTRRETNCMDVIKTAHARLHTDIAETCFTLHSTLGTL